MFHDTVGIKNQIITNMKYLEIKISKGVSHKIWRKYKFLVDEVRTSWKDAFKLMGWK
jgi:hypothetical protein